MNPIVKAVLKVLSTTVINVKKHYKLYRGLIIAANPYLKPLYHVLDYKMMVADREIPLRVFPAKRKGQAKALIFFHGGGWVTGNIDTYTHICAHMAKETGHTVVSVNYRLAPEHPFPEGLEDCYFVTKELLASPHLLNCRAEDITIIGDSAGGNLAAALSLLVKARGGVMPTRQILLYPATHFDHSDASPFQSVHDFGKDYILTAARIETYMQMYTQKEKYRRDYLAAPLLATDLTGQPKTLIITAECDPLRDEGEAYGVKLREAGGAVRIYRIPEMIHGFLILPKMTRAVKTCYSHINRFLNDEEDDD